MNSFTREQEAFIEKVAWAVGDKIEVRLMVALMAALKEHEAQCQWGKRITRLTWIGMGIAIGFGLAGYGVGWAVAKAVAGMP
ncbi:MAG TPA: hypothetical protein VMW52_07565 [Phycisphaerae bacterium]|nr:hypothetical protein [Phycisphaerae bacterium]